MANLREPDYLEEAKLARRRAQTARDPDVKAAWLSIADKYEALAEIAAKNRS